MSFRFLGVSTLVFSLLSLLGLLVTFGACSSCASKDEQAAQRGVNDVTMACDIRAGWKNRTAEKCISCISAAPSPPCNCEAFRGFGGMCSAQGEARRVEPSCTTAVDLCTKACGEKDCNCVDGCYAEVDACKAKSAARDGCVAEVCAPYCQ